MKKKSKKYIRSSRVKTIRHGMYHTRPYGIWSGMKRRCYNRNDKSYERYGARGITICEEWRAGFLNFWNDMKETYFDDATIDRIDNSLGYSKANCRWITAAEQARNKRSVKLYQYQGRTVSLGQLEKELSLPRGLLNHRVKKLGWSISKAIQTPKIPRIANINS